jgi:hypothetical protein
MGRRRRGCRGAGSHGAGRERCPGKQHGGGAKKSKGCGEEHEKGGLLCEAFGHEKRGGQAVRRDPVTGPVAGALSGKVYHLAKTRVQCRAAHGGALPEPCLAIDTDFALRS